MRIIFAKGFTMQVQYSSAEKAWFGFEPFLRSLIIERRAVQICEVGAGANPILPLDFLHEHNVEYTLLDISAAELAKAPEGYHKLELDILAPRIPLRERFDLVFSRMVAEHMADGEQFHRNVAHILRRGGTAFHYFPTLMAFPFVVNKFVDGAITERLLHLVQGGRERGGKHSKFPAFYKWCRGPVRRQIARLERVGYTIDQYTGFYGHAYYARIKPLYNLHAAFSRYLIRHPLPSITTYAYVVMRKTGPDEDAAPAETFW